MSKYQLDVRNLLCPMPVIRTQNKANQLQSGDVLEIIATDPGVMQDIPAWARIHDHKIIAKEQKNKEIIITIEIK